MVGRSWASRVLGTALVAATLALFAPVPPASAAVPVLVLDGAGYGHGVGLSQWGAEHLARTGRSTEQILGTFYPGASLGEATGPVRVSVHRPAVSTTTVTFPQGGEVRSAIEGGQAPGFPVRVGPGGRVRITFDGSYRVDPLVSGQSAASATSYRSDPCALVILCPPTTQPPPTTSTTAPPTTTPPPAGEDPGAPGGPPSTAPAPPPPAAAGAASSTPVWAVPAEGGVTTVDDRGRSYRGVLEATGGGALRLVNVIGVEDYLRGMAEVPGGWPAAAVGAQTIAARTYALRAMQAGGELCDDARCQVYVGRTAESPGQDAAVAATARRVVVFNGALAAAVYSADAGGVSATTLEGFGTPDGVYPYLTTVHYETDNPLPWHLEVGFGDLATRLRYPGTVSGARVGSTGPSGRALTMVVEGSAGEVTVDGRAFARSLGLRSTRFVVAVGSATAAPPPPPAAEEPIQLLPTETAAVARTPLRPSHGLDIDRRMPASPAIGAPALPPALDPRRHLLALVAGLLVAAVAGAHVPLALRAPVPSARRFGGAAGRARPWQAWRPRTRTR
jgi:SpoIID/LytB domain protein